MTTLKEQIENIEIFQNDYESFIADPEAVEKIVDEFAMSFGNWLSQNISKPKLYVIIADTSLIRLPMKDILLIFKKEKCL